MDRPGELRLLRLAVARGLVTWEDLERAARRASGPDTPGGGEIDPGAWLDALVAEGLLDRSALERLATQSEHRPADPVPAAPAHALGSEDSRIARDLEILDGWDRYEVITALGTGGMGSVYKVFDPSLMRFAAVKILHRSEPDQGERLLREARAQARVDHPNVCQVFEAGEVQGHPYIAMQHIDGVRLDEAVSGLARAEVVALFAAVARAVHAAHATGLVHRDLKPGNILVARRSSGALHPYVVDFGLARDLEDTALSRSDVITGTPAYLAPEQIRGQPVDARTDVFSLGVVLFEALTGRTPFAGGSVPETLVRITGEEPARPRKLDPTIPPDLETILLRCLEKAPSRRYQSARALAEDLDRYLAGEPILARAPTFAYRASKKLRKNRALAAVAAGAGALVLTMLLVSLRTAWVGRERAEVAQRFGQEVEEVESSLRLALLLPLHDTTAHKAALRARMAGIRTEMARLGELAGGPGHFALGQAHLALHDYEEARRHLEAAWTSGFREPEVAAALGSVFGHLYTRAITEAQVASGTAERKAFLSEVQRTYREPAVSYLRESSARSGSASAYVEGLVALYEERYADALAHARRAAEEQPSLVEARRLQGEVYVIQGNEALDQGRHDEAMRLYEQAGEIYGELLETYRSDAGLYAAECGRRSQVLEVHSRIGRLPEAGIASALAACDRALVADRGLAEAHSKRARIHWRIAEDRALYGEDPVPALEQAIASAGAAIALDPRDFYAQSHLSVAHRRMADWRMNRGQDPTAALASAIGAARRAVDLAPAREWAYVILGNALYQRALHLHRHGADPRPDLDLAASAYGRAVEISPRMTSALTNLGAAWKARAEYEIGHGIDPTGSIERSLAALGAALEVNPASASIHNNLGTAHLTHGYYLVARGQDPSRPLERAGASYREALAINPAYPFGFYNLAFVERCLALYELRRGRDPGPDLDRARAALERAIELNAADPDNFLEKAQIELLAAEWRRRRGRDPGGALAEAAVALRRGLGLNAGDPRLHHAAARAEEVRAGWAADRGEPAGGALREGIAAAERALALNPEMAEALAVRGALRFLEARLAGDPDEARARAAQAVADLEAAFGRNPFLETDYGALARSAR
ncbi:MAG TPA: protein kinase, partial [Thermoanaerobaculia bacterium]|nr:protein kinase [Thermoanaerobaculia bacterium]